MRIAPSSPSLNPRAEKRVHLENGGDFYAPFGTTHVDKTLVIGGAAIRGAFGILDSCCSRYA